MAESTPRHRLPHIHFLCRFEENVVDWNLATMDEELPSSVNYTMHHCSLQDLPQSVKYDTIVSPANSYGRLDGAFDDAISKAFSPRDDYFALTTVAQKKLYRLWKGMAPPGTCTIVRIPDGFVPRSKNVWGTKYVALCPTMRLPEDVTWDREIVYECVWSLLNAIENHNRLVREGTSEPGETEITSICMTPLATGVGRVSSRKWAAQAALAIKHFVQACENPELWSSLDFRTIGDTHIEIERTHLY